MRNEPNGGRGIRALFKIGLHFGHHLRGEWRRDKRGARLYKAAGESVKNRQLHRQKQDAESIHPLKVRGGAGMQQQTDSQRKDQWC